MASASQVSAIWGKTAHRHSMVVEMRLSWKFHCFVDVNSGVFLSSIIKFMK
jgi:hypothetical protein